MGGGGLFGGGGGGSTPPVVTPEVKETPKAQQVKNVTEASTSARETQKAKASKAAGLRGSILTSDLSSGAGGEAAKTKLGE